MTGSQGLRESLVAGVGRSQSPRSQSRPRLTSASLKSRGRKKRQNRWTGVDESRRSKRRATTVRGTTGWAQGQQFSDRALEQRTGS